MGGIDATGNALASTEIATATGSTAGPHLASARVGHTATYMNTGKVLVAGGQSGANATTAFNTTEIYDPVAGTFSAGGTLAAARSEAIAIEFGTAGNLQVLIAGGSNGTTPVNTAEVYNESTGTSTALTGMMVEAHAGASAALMDDGTVLIVGGVSATGPAGAEIFDPTTNTFSPATMTTKRSGAAFASTGSEAVVAGGQASTGVQSSTEDYAISTKTFATGATLTTARMNATASVVGGTNVLFIGGQATTGAIGTTELLSGSTIAAGTIAAGPSLATARFGHTATTLSSGSVLVIGGFTASGSVTNSIESITPPVSSTGTGTGTTGSTGSGSSGLGGLLSGLLGALTGSGGSSGIGSLLSGLLGGSGGSGLSSILGSLLGGGSSTGGSGLSSILGSLLGGLTGSGSGSSSGGFGSILSSLLGALTGGSGSGSGGFGSILSSLLGSLTGGSGGGLGSLLSGLFGGGSAASINGVTPPSGVRGTTVQLTISTSGFGTVNSVTVGAYACTNIANSGGSITCTLTIPSAAQVAAGGQTVTVSDTSSNTASLPNGFTFQ